MIVSMAEAKLNKKFAELAKLKEKIERQILNEVSQRTNRVMDRTQWRATVNGSNHLSKLLVPKFSLHSVR